MYKATKVPEKPRVPILKIDSLVLQANCKRQMDHRNDMQRNDSWYCHVCERRPQPNYRAAKGLAINMSFCVELHSLSDFDYGPCRELTYSSYLGITFFVRTSAQ